MLDPLLEWQVVNEFLFGILVWFKETRYWAIGSIVLMHLGLEALINVQLFGWLMISSMILFVDSTYLQSILSLNLLR